MAFSVCGSGSMYLMDKIFIELNVHLHFSPPPHSPLLPGLQQSYCLVYFKHMLLTIQAPYSSEVILQHYKSDNATTWTKTLQWLIRYQEIHNSGL